MNILRTPLLAEAQGDGDGSGGGAPAAPAAPEGPYSGFMNPDGSFASENWADNAPESIKPYVGAAQNYKSIEDLFKGHAHWRDKVGNANATVVPGEDGDEAAVSGFRKAVGAPSEADGYGLHHPPENLPEGVEWSGEFGKKANELLHKYHVPKELAGELAKLHLGMMEEASTSGDAAHTAYVAETDAKLKGKFTSSQEYEQSFDTVKQTFAALSGGVDYAAADEADIHMVLLQMGKALREDPIMRSTLGIHGDQMNPMNSDNPRTKATDIIQNSNNPLHQKYKSGDPGVRAMVENLFKQANG